MSRLPIRARLTAAFALAMVIVLALTCGFVYRNLRADFDEAIVTGLQARARAATALTRRGQPLAGAETALLTEGDESFTQTLAADGRLLGAIGAVRVPALDPGALRRATRETVLLERTLPGVDAPVRVLARRLDGPGSAVVAVGQSLEDRNEALAALLGSFAIGGPLAVLLASLVGYGLATAGLAPVEAMRRRAAEISLTGDQERLPLPAARDEIHRLGETLNAMLDRLRGSFEREQRFVADASHELRTPVAVLKTELEAALRTGDYGPDVRDALVAAVEECDRLASMAEDLLVLARAADGRLPTRAEQLDARALLQSTRDRFADRAGQRGRRIRIDAADELRVVADPLRLRQAVGNLLDNALRHGDGEIVLSARAVDGAVDIDVTDAGPGFGGDLGERAFERFTSGTGEGQGAGLGLAIVRAIAEAHGGRAMIVSGPGSTTVRLRLPNDLPGAPGARPGPAGAPAAALGPGA